MISFLSERTESRATTMSATGRRRNEAAGFTLVEVVTALAVIAIITAMAVPAIDGVQKERIAREPINELYLMAREVRLRAMQERRPYQILFDGEGFRASRFFQPYGGVEEFEELQRELEVLDQQNAILEASADRGISMEEEVVDPRLEELEEGIRYASEYLVDPSLRLSLRVWNENDWVLLRGGEFRRWVFQPSGMCEPMSVRMENDGSFFEVTFHPLTADIQSERSWVE